MYFIHNYIHNSLFIIQKLIAKLMKQILIQNQKFGLSILRRSISLI